VYLGWSGVPWQAWISTTAEGNCAAPARSMANPAFDVKKIWEIVMSSPSASRPTCGTTRRWALIVFSFPDMAHRWQSCPARETSACRRHGLRKGHCSAGLKYCDCKRMPSRAALVHCRRPSVLCSTTSKCYIPVPGWAAAAVAGRLWDSPPAAPRRGGPPTLPPPTPGSVEAPAPAADGCGGRGSFGGRAAAVGADAAGRGSFDVLLRCHTCNSDHFCWLPGRSVHLLHTVKLQGRIEHSLRPYQKW